METHAWKNTVLYMVVEVVLDSDYRYAGDIYCGLAFPLSEG